ncbi:hypothetical protein J4E83_000619 [Alternaria metachromatica]|uniref:uncharacterized protein n=1 Tax=Alternaria metachromatica TaxID=283354 RepID=UPI0020C3961E|nr:uncharacterized protein J4E83_000619 [Alternaria metachromatica]KAI4637801.1 hypothetical protein J4E83_000619 [Alternaria metachromatica]
MKDGNILHWLRREQPTRSQTKAMPTSSRTAPNGHVSKPKAEKIPLAARITRSATAAQKVPIAARVTRSAPTAQKKAGGNAAPCGRGKDKKPRRRRTKAQLKYERLQRARNDAGAAEAVECTYPEENANTLPLPVGMDASGARLPAEVASESSINNSPPALFTASPLTSVSRPHLLETRLQQQFLEEDKQQQTREVRIPKQRTTMTSKRAAKRQRKARKAREEALEEALVFIKSESIDGSQDAPRNFAYDTSTGSSSYQYSSSPARQPWAAPKRNSIIDLIRLCTYPGQTIHPNSVNRLFILQRDIDAAMDGQGRHVWILRRLPRDITLTVERKEAIWLAQGQINRVVDERGRSRRRLKLDRYVPADRWVTIDRYIPGMPYPLPLRRHAMPRMRVFSRSYA